MSEEKKRLPELNVLSGIAIVCVLLIHSNAGYLLSILNLKKYTEASFSVRLLDNFIHGAVPLFIFISGCKWLINNINDPYIVYAKKKLKKCIPPFVIITLIFLFRDIIKHPNNYCTMKMICIQMVNIMVGRDNPAYHLWYISMYVFVSLTYPFIYCLIKNDKVRVSILVLLSLVHKGLGITYPLILERPFNYIYYWIFFEMGVIWIKYNVKEKVKNLGFLSILSYIIGAFFQTMNLVPEAYDILQAYILWPLSIVAYYTISVKLCENKLLNYLGKYSLYIYLLHEPLILSKIFQMVKWSGIYDSQIWVWVVAILSLVITLVAYFVLMKVIEFCKFICQTIILET